MYGRRVGVCLPEHGCLVMIYLLICLKYLVGWFLQMSEALILVVWSNLNPCVYGEFESCVGCF